MKCTRCNTILPDGSSHCPYCGKRWEGKVRRAEPEFAKQKEKPEKQQEDQLDDTYDTDSVPGLLTTYDQVDAPENMESEVADSGEELELLYHPPEPEDEDETRAFPTFAASGAEDHPDAGRGRSTATEREWEKWDQSMNNGGKSKSTDPDFHWKSRIFKKKSNNIIAGFMSIFLAFFMLVKGGAFLLNHLEIFKTEIYETTVQTWLEIIQTGVLMLVVFFVAAVARPVWLKILAILFAFAAVVVYALYGYFLIEPMLPPPDTFPVVTP